MRSHRVPIRTALLLPFVLLCGTANRAGAAPTGYNLFWDDCSLGAAQVDATDPCASEAGSHRLVMSLMPGEVLESVIGVNVVIRMVVDAPVLPDWWRLDGGGCRTGKLIGDYLIGIANPPFSCVPAWNAQVQGGVQMNLDLGGGLNRANILFVAGVPAPVTLDPGVSSEWYLGAISILRAGTATCSGCSVPACLVLNEMRIVRPAGYPGGDLILTSPALSAHATWQGGGAISCPGATPVRDRTWGQVKQLYR